MYYYFGTITGSSSSPLLKGSGPSNCPSLQIQTTSTNTILYGSFPAINYPNYPITCMAASTVTMAGEFYFTSGTQIYMLYNAVDAAGSDVTFYNSNFGVIGL